MKILETERLLLREWKESDIEDFFEYASMEDLGVHAGWPTHKSIEESKKILKMFIESHSEYAIVYKQNKKVIGSVGIKNKICEEYKERDQRTIGYCLNSNYWHKGIMSEAVQRIHEYLFDDVGVDLLWIEHFKENDRSKRVIEKAGYQHLKESVYHAPLLEKSFDCFQYILTRDVYSETKGLRKEFPILEFDDDENALINPISFKKKEKVYNNKMIVCFFQDVLKQLQEKEAIIHYDTIGGENPIPVYQFEDGTLIMQGAVGGAACAGNLEEVIALGSKYVTFCGGGGSLHSDITVGKTVVVDCAIRDDGISYHYMKPSREVSADPKVIELVSSYLVSNGIEHVVGKVWTTDAFYRETKRKIALRSAEGCLMVEMEQAGMLAVTNFRNIKYAALIYGGDDCTQEKWDERNWKDKYEIRHKLVMLCKGIALEMEKSFEG